jgi:hypothetical protein
MVNSNRGLFYDALVTAQIFFGALVKVVVIIVIFTPRRVLVISQHLRE